MMFRHIRTPFAFASILLLAALAAPAAAQVTQDTTNLPESMRTARATMSAAFSALDGTAAAAVFAEDGAVDFQGQLITGQQAVGGWFAEVFSGMSALRSGSSTFVIAENEITERGSYVAVMPDGEQAGSSETIWRRQEDGSWKVARLVVL